MARISKVCLFLVVVLAVSSLVMINPAEADKWLGYKLNMISPNNQTAYSGSMPLYFTINWSQSYIPWFSVNLSYTIDNGPKIPTNGGGTLAFKNEILTSTTNDTVDVSNLASGLHKLTIFIEGTYDLNNCGFEDFSDSFASINFSVNILPPNEVSTPTPTPSPSPTVSETSTPSPSPTVPEFPFLIVIALLLSVLAVALAFRIKKASLSKK